MCARKAQKGGSQVKTAAIQRTSGFRINRILKSDLVIIDEIGYTPIERKEANLFFNLISELYQLPFRAAMFHTVGNPAHELFRVAPTEASPNTSGFMILTVLYYVAAIVIVGVYGTKTLRRERN